MSKLLKSVIKKRTNVNMNDTYYIPDPDTLDGDRDGSDGDRDGSDESEDGGERDEEQDKCIKEQEQEGDRSDEDRSDEEKSVGSDGEGEGEEGCCECNNENCTYFSIDNECKIKCISCE
jgi:hypothetical protein